MLRWAKKKKKKKKDQISCAQADLCLGLSQMLKTPIKMTQIVRKYTFRQGCLAKIQISLHIWVVWPVSSLGTLWIVKNAKFLQVDNKDWSDCTDVQADLSSLWAHIRRNMSTSCCGSNYNTMCKRVSTAFWNFGYTRQILMVKKNPL